MKRNQNSREQRQSMPFSRNHKPTTFGQPNVTDLQMDFNECQNQLQNKTIENVSSETSSTNEEASIIDLLKTILDNQAKQSASATPIRRNEMPTFFEQPKVPCCQMHSCKCNHQMQSQPFTNVPARTDAINDNSTVTSLLKSILQNQTNQEASVSPSSSRNDWPSTFQQQTVFRCPMYSNHCLYQTQNHPYQCVPAGTAAANEDPSIKSLLDTILQNQSKQATVLNYVVNMQEKIMKKLESQPVHSHTMEAPNKAPFKKIDSIEDCHEFEENLKSLDFVAEMMKYFESVCGANSDLYGDNVAYALVDHIFTRRLFTLVSWTGLSRGTESKECFLKFERIFQFFFDLIRKVDSNYSIKALKDFFQKIISNSKRRFEHKRLRTSRVKISSNSVIKRQKRYAADNEGSSVQQNSNCEEEQEIISDEVTDNDDDSKDNISIYAHEWNVDEVTQMQEAGCIKAEKK